MKGYVVSEKEKRLYYSDCLIIQNPSDLGLIAHPQRVEIMKLLAKKRMYVSELSKKLKVHEQNIYYHLKKLLKADVLEEVERKEIRGTIAKMYQPRSLNLSLLLDFQQKPMGNLVTKEIDPVLKSFLNPFISDNELNSLIVVGNPDPHGQFKARARDGHYAVDLAMFLGQYSHFPRLFSVKLDVDVTDIKQNLIIIGGPATNLLANKLNPHFDKDLEISFSEKRPFGIISKRTARQYSDPTVGFIAKMTNPFESDKKILCLAGISSVGTKAAVIALTRHYDQLLANYRGTDFYAVIQGFDLDGDGRIDSAEVIE